MGSTTQAHDSDASKNELLRAMDLRLNALREELTTAFAQAAVSKHSLEELVDVVTFSRHLGSTGLSDSLCKHIEQRHGAHVVGPKWRMKRIHPHQSASKILNG